ARHRRADQCGGGAEAVRIVIAGGGTGGHLMPALALAQAMRAARPDVELLLVGAERGIEAQVLAHHPFPYRLLPLEPLYRRAWWRNLRWPRVALRVWRASDRLLAEQRPAVVAGTGRVVVRGFFDPMASAYRVADLVVSRAGAMTVAELCAWGRPSILVPLPSAAADHQTWNARALAAAGAAVLLAERDLRPDSLALLVTQLVTDPARLATLGAQARVRGHPDAAREIVS